MDSTLLVTQKQVYYYRGKLMMDNYKSDKDSFKSAINLIPRLDKLQMLFIETEGTRYIALLAKVGLEVLRRKDPEELFFDSTRK